VGRGAPRREKAEKKKGPGGGPPLAWRH